MAWNTAKEAATELGNGGGLFLRLTEDGSKAKIVLAGEPQAYTKVWEDGPRKRVMTNVFNVDTKDMQIFDMSPTTFRDLLSLVGEVGDGKVILVKRDGLGMKTKYQFMPLTDASEAQLKEREKGLHNLSEFTDGSTDAGADEEVPF